MDADPSVGLCRSQVEESRNTYGANELTPPKRPSLWRLYADKFRDPVIRILLVAAFLSLGIAFVERDFAETIGIFCAVLLATGIGFYFEYDAARKFDVLNALSADAMVRVRRDGQICEIPRSEVVVGDVLWLETGDEIPADARLLTAMSLLVNESSLTGEPVVRKSVRPQDADPDAPYASDCLMRGTLIVEGSATARVTAVGDATEIGKVAREATALTGEKTPLNKQLDRLASLISRVGYSVAVVAFILFTAHGLYVGWPDVARWQSEHYLFVVHLVLNNFMMAVTLIVMAVPEGLPMAVTLSLALNMRRMLKTNNLVRKMHACETMGAITVICTDKTGTLTQNRMTVVDFMTGDVGISNDRLADAVAYNTTAFLNDDRTAGLGNPTEVALLLWMQDNGFDYRQVRAAAQETARLPFSSERKYMVTCTYSAARQRHVLWVKGAPEILLPHCSLTAGRQEELRARLADWQHHAHRTLVLACKDLADERQTDDCQALVETGGLTLLAVVAISDPVRSEVPQAVADCRKAGVQVKMVTGDSVGTAIEIARQIGLWTTDDSDRNVIKGADFAALTDEEALGILPQLKVMSRARPLDKQRLVRLLQQRGEVVAVTGDGTNDAPALNLAQVGLAMGSGTSVAKEAGDITLLDDSFRSIVTAVMWGRSLYRNIQRFVLFQLTINVTALLIVLIGAFVGTQLPLTVTQMLWINIIMDTFAALALASLPADPRVMSEKPRPVGQFIITPSMRNAILGYGFAFVTVLLGWLLWAGNNGGMTPRMLSLFFTFFVMLQFWNLLNAKAYATDASAFTGLRSCYGVGLVLLFIAVGQWVLVQFGGRAFRTVPLSMTDWLWVTGVSSLVLWVGEGLRAVARLRRSQ